MSELTHVTVTREANVYFDGKVTSRKLTLADGSIKTLGIMMPGDYTFGTEQAELMDVMAGELSYQLKDTTEWHQIKAGESFNIPANSSFDIKVNQLVDYCCTYLD